LPSIVFIGVSSSAADKGIVGTAAVSLGGAVLLTGAVELPLVVLPPVVLAVGGWLWTGTLLRLVVVFVVVVLIVGALLFVFATFPGCEQLETPKVASSAIAMKVMSSRRAVQNPAG
jgi:hypothetical protein